MALTNTQLATLKAAIQADANINTIPNHGDGHYAIAAYYAQTSSKDVWRSDAPVASILDAIDASKYTPTDAASDSDTAAVAVAKTNRLLAIQTKQMNLQLMLQGRDTLDCTKANVRAGLRDAVIAVPSGASGANVNPGGSSGSSVLNQCIRKANKGEDIFATSTATTGATTAYLLVFEGQLSMFDIQSAMDYV